MQFRLLPVSTDVVLVRLRVFPLQSETFRSDWP